MMDYECWTNSLPAKTATMTKVDKIQENVFQLYQQRSQGCGPGEIKYNTETKTGETNSKQEHNRLKSVILTLKIICKGTKNFNERQKLADDK